MNERREQLRAAAARYRKDMSTKGLRQRQVWLTDAEWTGRVLPLIREIERQRTGNSTT